MNGKYIKTKRVIIPMLTILMSSSVLFGCGVATQEEATQIIQETPTVEVVVNEPIDETTTPSENKAEKLETLDWIEVGKLESNPELRKEFDSIFGVTGETGAKDGWVYQNNDQNITLYKAFEDENTILVVYGLEDEVLGIVNENRPKLAKSAGASYVDADDLSTDEQIAMAMNGYFNLLPDAEAGYSNPYETLTRAQAMALLMRAMTPVSDIEANADFATAVGENDYNIYAQEVTDYVLLNVENGGLDSENYNLGMTKAEAVYMITQAFYEDDYTYYMGAQSMFDDLEMAENVAGNTDREILDEMIATGKVDNRIYTAYCVAEAHNMFPDEMTESEWSETITKAEFINYLMRAMAEKNYPGCTRGYTTEAMAEEFAAKMDEEADKDTHNQSVDQQQTTEQTTQKTTEQTTQKTTEQTTEQTQQPTTEQTTEQTTQKTTEQTTQKTTEQTTQKTTEQTTQKTTEQTTQKTTEQTTQKTTEQTTEQTTQKTTEQTTQKTTEQTTQKTTEQTTQKTTEQTTQKTTEQTTEQTTQKKTQQKTQQKTQKKTQKTTQKTTQNTTQQKTQKSIPQWIQEGIDNGYADDYFDPSQPVENDPFPGW